MYFRDVAPSGLARPRHTAQDDGVQSLRHHLLTSVSAHATGLGMGQKREERPLTLGPNQVEMFF